MVLFGVAVQRGGICGNGVGIFYSRIVAVVVGYLVADAEGEILAAVARFTREVRVALRGYMLQRLARYLQIVSFNGDIR